MRNCSSVPNDLIELLQDLALLVHKQPGVADNVDEQNVGDLEMRIELWF